MKRVLILFCLMVIQLLLMENSKAVVRDSHPKRQNDVSYEMQSKLENEILIETNKQRKKHSTSKFKHTRKGKNNGKFKLKNKGRNKKTAKGNKWLDGKNSGQKGKKKKITVNDNKKQKKQSTSKFKNTKRGGNKNSGKFKSRKKAEKIKGNKWLDEKNSGQKEKKKKMEVNANRKRRKQSLFKSKNTKGGNIEKNGKFKLKNKGRNKNAKRTKGNKKLNTKKSGHRGRKKEKGANSHKNRDKNSNNDKRRKKNKYKKKRVERKKIKYFKHKYKNLKVIKKQRNNNKHQGTHPVPDCDFHFMLDIINTDKKFRDVLAKLQRMERWWKLLFSKETAAKGSVQCASSIPPTFSIPFDNLECATAPGGGSSAPSSCSDGETRCGCDPITGAPKYDGLKNTYGHLHNCTKSAKWACSREDITYDRIWIPPQASKAPCYNNNKNSEFFGHAELCCESNCIKNKSVCCDSSCALNCKSKEVIDKIKECKSNINMTCPKKTGKFTERGNVTCGTTCTQPTARFVLTQEMMDHVSDVCIPQLRNWTLRYTSCNNLKPEGDCSKACQSNLNFYECKKNKCECEHKYLPSNEKKRRCKFETCLYETETVGPSTVKQVEKCQCECYLQIRAPETYTTWPHQPPAPIFPINKNTTFPPINKPAYNKSALDCITLAGFERLVKIRMDRCALAGGIDEMTNAKTNPALPTILPTLQAPPPGLGPGNGLRPAPRKDPLKQCVSPDKRQSNNFADCRYQGREAVPWIYNCKGPYTCMTTSRFSSGRNKFLSQIKKLFVEKTNKKK